MTALSSQLYLQGFQPPKNKSKDGKANGKIVKNIYFGKELENFQRQFARSGSSLVQIFGKIFIQACRRQF